MGTHPILLFFSSSNMISTHDFGYAHHLGFYRAGKRMIVRTNRDDPHKSILFSSQSVIVTSSKMLAESVNDLAMRFGASVSLVYELGSAERIAGYDADRSSEVDSHG